MKASKLCVTICAGLLLTVASVGSQEEYPSFAHAMYANGYTRAICVDHFEWTPPGCDPAIPRGESGACRGQISIDKVYPANPNAALPHDRYGYGANGCKGSTGGGEAGPCQFITEYVSRGFLPGFNPVGYDACASQNFMDRSDSWYFTRNGRTTAFEDILATIGRPAPAPTPIPSPYPINTPTPAPSPAPTLPPCDACEPYVPAAIPIDILDRLRSASNIAETFASITGPRVRWLKGRKALSAQLRDDIQMINSALREWRVFQPAPRTSGQAGRPCLDNPPGACNVKEGDF